ncbi:hypothetical protein Pmani_035269 [Petrolisthes manimaculis]|uniref:E3 ubiquitin-protein ligase ZNRF1 n=1 Tax=Petrolisthes manimaculis TaxID=1843537 RepID=A0AAE1NKT8_9EUCA|nr:hypothetical protein Pmani_035269 [Petrolisthes manimaculis]
MPPPTTVGQNRNPPLPTHTLTPSQGRSFEGQVAGRVAPGQTVPGAVDHSTPRQQVWWASHAHPPPTSANTAPAPPWPAATQHAGDGEQGWCCASGGKVAGATVMASCWRGMGVLLGTCVPSRPTHPHPTHTPTPTSVPLPSPTPPSTATSARILSGSPSHSRHHSHHHHHHSHHHSHHHQSQQGPPGSAEGPGARYLLVRPATAATPPSPRRRHHSRHHGSATSGSHSGRGEGRAGRAADVEGTPPLLLLSQALHLPPPPPHLASLIYTYGFKCPICSKLVLPDDLECHLVICLTKPRITYNEDVLTEDKGECVICLEELCQGDTIARLPCLCIYHKSCIDEWFQVNRSCPEHPYD